MTEEELRTSHQRCLMLLGMGTHIILQDVVSEQDRIWWKHAIEEVVYRNNPIPPNDTDKPMNKCDHLIGIRLPQAGYDPTLIICESDNFIMDDYLHYQIFNFCPDCGQKLEESE